MSRKNHSALRRVLLLVAVLAACRADEPATVVLSTTTGVVERAAPLDSPASTIHAVEADVERWYATALWHGTVAWNEAVAANERAAAEAAARNTARPSGSGTYTGGGVWAALAECESGGDWSYNGSSGFDGGLQFSPGTWSAYKLPGYPAYAWQATPSQQIAVAERVLAAQGWRAWPACSLRLGLR